MEEVCVPQESNEAEMRSAFIQLDVRAVQVGGAQNLSTEERWLYVHSGWKTGFLNEGEASRLAEQFGLEGLGDWRA